MAWQPFALGFVALTLIVALLLSARDFLNTPIASTYTRWGSLILTIGLGLFFVAWVRGDSFLFADLLLLAGVMMLIVARRRGERQPYRGFRRRAKR